MWYYIEDSEISRIKRASLRLYSEVSLSADEMRDMASSLDGVVRSIREIPVPQQKESPLYGVKEGGKIYLTRKREAAEELVANFRRRYANPEYGPIVELVNVSTLPILKQDGYDLLSQCQKCEVFVREAYGVDSEDFLVVTKGAQTQTAVRFICSECLRG